MKMYVQGPRAAVVRAGAVLRAVFLPVALIAALAVVAAAPAAGQPFGAPGSFLQLESGEGYVEVPNAASLNPSPAFTIEFWSYSSDSRVCANLVGKRFSSSFWVGNCDGVLRSYLGGVARDGGKILANLIVH